MDDSRFQRALESRNRVTHVRDDKKKKIDTAEMENGERDTRWQRERERRFGTRTLDKLLPAVSVIDITGSFSRW